MLTDGRTCAEIVDAAVAGVTIASAAGSTIKGLRRSRAFVNDRYPLSQGTS